MALRFNQSGYTCYLGLSIYSTCQDRVNIQATLFCKISIGLLGIIDFTCYLPTVFCVLGFECSKNRVWFTLGILNITELGSYWFYISVVSRYLNCFNILLSEFWWVFNKVVILSYDTIFCRNVQFCDWGQPNKLFTEVIVCFIVTF